MESIKERWLNELREFLSFASISTDPAYREEVVRSAEWLASHFRKIGFSAQLIETNGHPLVYAERIVNRWLPTLLICSHYDVQPADPLEEWLSPPFEAVIRDGNLYARGVSDSKGQLFSYIKGVESVLEKRGELPINVKFIIEGEEESNGKSLVDFLEENREMLAADGIIYAGGAMVDKDTPGICCGARGLLAAEIEVIGSESNLHSGTFGGKVPNSAICLAQILTQISTAKFWKQLGSSFDINSLKSGYSGEGFQFIIPASASAKVSFRLLPWQNPEDIFKDLTGCINDSFPPPLKVNIKKCDEANGVTLSRESAVFKTAFMSLEKTFGRDPLWYVDFGAVPILHELKKMNENLVMVGFGLDDDNLHAPNEKLNLESFFKGVEFAGRLLENFGVLCSSK